MQVGFLRDESTHHLFLIVCMFEPRYVMAKLPEATPDDRAFAEQLVKDYGVAIIPGSFCGFPGWIRVCYSNLPPDKCLKAAERLEKGIEELCGK
jgi:aromatic aminotransferase